MPSLILIVEDEQHAREGLAEFLLSRGYRVTDAADGAEALLKVDTLRPDLVVLDLAIPRTDGWTVAQRLKTDPRFRRMPVIALSALDYPDEVRRALDAGCDAFLAKPCDFDRLLPTIELLLEKR